ncbi:MAG TPA: hypothetical protein VMV89_13620 [Candidatus Paceibacterota bacterium]|nr:hypothetical protein [Candidatus Paceibacterota bacterium]
MVAIQCKHSHTNCIPTSFFRWHGRQRFFYNALGVPLAALGFISPIFCAAAMGCSDLIVIGNALRLLRWKN